MGQQGFQWGEQWGLEGADMQYTCGAAATNARAREGLGGVEPRRNVMVVE